MNARWPAAMRLSVAAEYLDCSVKQVETLLQRGEFGALQYNERGDRRIRREDLDAFLERQSNVPVGARI